MTRENDNDEVRSVVEAYVAACAAADSDALRAVFHADANMSGMLAGQRMTGGVAPFVDVVANNPPPGADYTSQISDIEVSGKVAIATLREQNYMGMSFTNYFQLLNVDGHWLIVAKLFQSS
tara:strand:- start:424439 stop:424801 length:363 start_codon:yes stop_codon:yes gene_type:complete